MPDEPKVWFISLKSLASVLSVRLKPGENVAWLWSLLPRGGRYVSGYRIAKLRGFSVMRESAMHDVPMEVAL